MNKIGGFHKQVSIQFESREDMRIDELTKRVIGCAFQVHNELGSGFLEKVYENALAIALRDTGLTVEQQRAIPVSFRGHIVGDFLADIVVEDCLIVELKAVRTLAQEHEVQLVNYLSATGIDNGLLMNFGPSVEVKRKFRVYGSAR